MASGNRNRGIAVDSTAVTARARYKLKIHKTKLKVFSMHWQWHRQTERAQTDRMQARNGPARAPVHRAAQQTRSAHCFALI